MFLFALLPLTKGKTYVATEVPWMCEIDKSTLDTIKMVACREKLGGQCKWLVNACVFKCFVNFSRRVAPGAVRGAT